MENKLIKRIFVVIIALATLLSLAACGDKSKDRSDGDECDHEYKSETVIVNRKSKYCYKYTCKECGEVKYKDVDVVSVSDNLLYDEDSHWTNLLYKERVSAGGKKKVTVTKNYKIDADEHNFDENGVCSDCYYNSSASEGLDFNYDRYNGGYVVVGRGSCSDSHINIPNEYNGRSVIGIADNSFEDIVTDYEELRVLGVTIPSTVVSIGCSAFAGCEELNSFIVDSSNEIYSVTDNCLIDNTAKSIVRGCEFSIIPGDGQVTAIGSYAFAGSSGLVSITIPETVEVIGDKAFMECDALIEVYMPENVDIGIDVFRGSIHVEVKISHTVVLVKSKKATCEEAGNIEYYVCTDCGNFYSDDKAEERIYDVTIPAAHNFVDGVCTKCSLVQDEVLIVSVETVNHLGKFPLGTLEDAIGLPKKINVMTLDGMIHELDVAWDLSEYDKSRVGEYTISGVIQSGKYHFEDGLDNKLEVGIEIVETVIGTADIVFILDISGSMGDEIANVKNNIINFSQAIENQGVSARWSVITYSDFTCGGDYNEITQIKKNGSSDWYTSAADCKNAINAIDLANGGDGPETAIDGLMMATTLTTRKNARVFYVLLTDYGYKTDNNYGIGSMSEAVNIINKNNVNVSVITGSEWTSSYSTLTNTTGGVMCNIGSYNFSQNLIDRLVPIIYGEVIS